MGSVIGVTPHYGGGRPCELSYETFDSSLKSCHYEATTELSTQHSVREVNLLRPQDQVVFRWVAFAEI